MGDKMYSIDEIEDNIVKLINNQTNEIIYVDKTIFDTEINEGDIVDENYTVDKKATSIIKEDIKDRFSNLIE